MSTGQEKMLVKNLLEPSTLTWDHNKLAQFLIAEDIRVVLQVPLSLRRTEDEIIWFSKVRGGYTVRSGYDLLRGLAN